MPKFKVLSGQNVVNIFIKNFHFTVKSQKGSHIKLVRYVGTKKQILIIPLHKELDRGTLKSIYKKSLEYLKSENIDKFFCE